MGIPEPTFNPPPDNDRTPLSAYIMAGLVACLFFGGLYYLGEWSLAHDLPRAVNRPALEYEILLFTGEKLSQVYPAQSYEITNFNAKGQLLQFSSDGVQHVYSGPFLVKEKR